jgi:hypothetical protein
LISLVGIWRDVSRSNTILLSSSSDEGKQGGKSKKNN